MAVVYSYLTCLCEVTVAHQTSSVSMIGADAQEDALRTNNLGCEPDPLNDDSILTIELMETKRENKNIKVNMKPLKKRRREFQEAKRNSQTRELYSQASH